MPHSLRILSIEDDPKDAELIHALLETEGIVCEITRVDTETELLACVKQGRIDLILADYSLPSFDGISALKLAIQACPDVPFIFVSGTLGEEVAIEALKIGATDYVLKTRLSRLVPAVLRALREAGERAERKQADEKLRRSEAYLSEAQRLSKTGSFGCNLSTGEMFWSEETFRIYGYDRSTQPAVERVLQRVHPEDRPLVQEQINRASRGGKDCHVECRLLLPDDLVKHVRIVAHASKNESGIVEFIGAVMDVTATKQGEEKLRSSEAYLAEAQKLSHTGSFGWRPSTGEILWSDETFRIFQFDRTTTPTVELVLQRVHPEDAASVKETVERASQDGKDFQHEYRLVMADGAVKHVRVMAHAVRDESGDIEFVGAVMDVTESKRAEEERERLRQVQADLAHLSRVTTMGELTASLAHEIKQPITAAVIDAKTCLRWLDRDDPELPGAREAASWMIKDVTRAADIISRISVLFKKGSLQRELVDVNELIQEMIVLLRGEANRYSISMRAELAEKLPKVMADRVQLQQVFMNLMLNGIDAMKETAGGGELTIKSEVGDGQLLISVSDTGVGLPPEQPEKIFKAFFTTKDNGTGMGLPISRSIIESHGGRLWAAGASAPGATFQFTLPATLAAHA